MVTKTESASNTDIMSDNQNSAGKFQYSETPSAIIENRKLKRF